MSVRDQERREKQLVHRLKVTQNKADRVIGAEIEEKQRLAEARADEVERRIEVGDVEPRPLPGKRRDSVESTESSPSTSSIESS